jgi:hypothetical protein
MSRTLAEVRLQDATASVEVTEDRNQKAKRAKKRGRKKFWVHETKRIGFRLMAR